MASHNSVQFNKNISVKYLGLPKDYEPSPDQDPIAFLTRHLHQLPPHLLLHFSYITTPKDRTTITCIRNRRLQYANKNPSELQFETARNTWPGLWTGRVDRRQMQEGKDEKAWAERDFLDGSKQHIGKLGNLLAEYEDERKAERVREIRRNMPPLEDEFVPEEDSDSDDDIAALNTTPEVAETFEESKASFERLIRERFIYGLLDNVDYDKVDWDENLIFEDPDAEERWFEDEDAD